MTTNCEARHDHEEHDPVEVTQVARRSRPRSRKQTSRLVGAGLTVGLIGSLAGVIAGGAHPAAASGLNSIVNPGPGDHVVAWGDNSAGQSTVPAALAGQDVVAVAATPNASYALTSSGQIIAWGDNGQAQGQVPTDLDGQVVAKIEAGNDGLVYAQTETGSLVGWGCAAPPDSNPSWGDLLPPVVQGQPPWVGPAPKNGWPATKIVADIASYDHTTVAVTSDGDVSAWQCPYEPLPGGLQESQPINVPSTLASGADFAHVSASGNHFTVLGDNAAGAPDQPGTAGVATQWQPGFSPGASYPSPSGSFTAVASEPGRNNDWLLSGTGRLIGWGAGANPPASLASQTVTQIATGTSFASALTSNDQVSAWGDDSLGETQLPAALSGHTVLGIAAGGSHGLAIVSNVAPDLALHRPVSASSSLETEGWGAANLTDGVTASNPGDVAYSSDPAQPTAQASNISVSVDLGTSQPVGSVVLYPRTAENGEDPSLTGADFPNSYQIQTSNDATNWTTVGTYSGQNADNGQPVTDQLAPGATGRYLRLVVSTFGRPAYNDDGYRLQLTELEAFAPSPANTDLAWQAPVSASSSLENEVWGAANLTNGQTTSTPTDKGYSSDPAQPTVLASNISVSVDLGTSQPVGAVVLYPRTAVSGEDPSLTGADFPNAYQIQTSNDGTNWTTVGSYSGQNADNGQPVTDQLAPGATGRYLRLVVSTFGRPAYNDDGYRLQLAQLQAYAP